MFGVPPLLGSGAIAYLKLDTAVVGQVYMYALSDSVFPNPNLNPNPTSIIFASHVHCSS